LYLEDMPDEKIIFQQVGSRTEFTKAGPWGNLMPATELVFIGRGEVLEPADLDRLLAPSHPAQIAATMAGTMAGTLLNS